MAAAALRNTYVSEGSVSGSPATIMLPWRSRQIVVSNDSSSNNLSVTFGGATLTLKPTETLSVNVWVDFVTFNGTAAYRLWAFG